MTPDAITDELRRLAELDMRTWNESDVREDFIAPLLRLLGYQKQSDYDINREGSHLLARPFFYVGRKRIDIDYALVVRRRSFWIIEAKSTANPALDEQALFQAHFYAIHPEVSARFFVVTNGLDTAIYDVRTIDDAYAPILRFGQRDLPDMFPELKRLVGAAEIRTVLRDRLLSDMREVLGTEVRIEVVESFESHVRALVREIRPLVHENWRKVFSDKHAASVRNYRAALATAKSGEELVRVAFEHVNSNADFRVAADAFAERFRRLDVSSQARLLAFVCRYCRDRPRLLERVNLIRLLLEHRDHDQAVAAATGESVLRQAKQSIALILEDYRTDPLQEALVRLELSLFRVVYKATFTTSARELFRTAAARKAMLLQEEDLVFQAPSSAGERVRFVERIVADVRRRAGALDVDGVRTMVLLLEAAEGAIEPDVRAALTSRRRDEQDLMFYASYGARFDVGTSALCNVLCDYFPWCKSLLDDEMAGFLVDKLRRLSTEYAVNYADVLLVRYWASLGRIRLSSEADAGFTSLGVAPGDVLPISGVHRVGNTATLAFEARIRVRENGWAKLGGQLDLGAREVAVLTFSIAE